MFNEKILLIPNLGEELEDALTAKVGPGGVRLIRRRFQLKGGPKRPDHHGTPSARRTHDRAVMLEDLRRLRNASDGQLARATIYNFTEDEPVDDGTDELFEE